MIANRRALIKIIGVTLFWNGIATASGRKVKNNKSLVCYDINELRTLNCVGPGQSIELLEYTKGSGVGGGVFSVDINDDVTPDDGGSCIVNSANQRLKRICPGNVIKATDYGMTGNNTDCTHLFKCFLSAECDKYIDVDIFTSGSANLKDGSKLTGKNGCVIYATESINKSLNKHNQGQTIEVGNNCIITNVNIDGNGFKNNGFLVFKKKNVIIQNCHVGNGLGQCILDVFSFHTHYRNNTLYKAQHGVQYWGSKSGISSNNLVFEVTGGIWTACSSEIVIKNNYIHDCSDVGIDFEGGNNCLSDGNKVEYCSNGELAIFGTGKEFIRKKIPMGNLLHKNNLIKRRGYYFDRTGNKKENHYKDLGACTVFGNIDSELIGPIIFEGNRVNIEEGDGKSLRCFASRNNSNSNMNLFFINNNFISSSKEIGLIMHSDKVFFEGNKFKILNGNANDSLIKLNGVSKVIFKNNHFDFIAFSSKKSPAIFIKKNNKNSKVNFEGNKFLLKGDGMIEVQCDDEVAKIKLSVNDEKKLVDRDIYL